MKCDKCGGNKTEGFCRLCELFECGSTFQGVEVCRQSNPSESIALKVRPRDVAKATEDARRQGVPTEFSKDGKPRFTSRRHKAQYCKKYGFVNLDGGYGD